MVAYFYPFHAKKKMNSICIIINVHMQHIYVSMQHNYVDKKNIIKLHVDINTFQCVEKSDVNIVLLHEDIIYLAYRRQTCTNIGIQNF